MQIITYKGVDYKRRALFASNQTSACTQRDKCYNMMWFEIQIFHHTVHDQQRAKITTSRELSKMPRRGRREGVGNIVYAISPHYPALHLSGSIIIEEKYMYLHVELTKRERHGEKERKKLASNNNNNVHGDKLADARVKKINVRSVFMSW